MPTVYLSATIQKSRTGMYMYALCNYYMYVYTGLMSVYMYIVHVHEYSMYNQNLNIYGLANVLYM